MTPGQVKTAAVGCGLMLFVLLVPGGVALWWELKNYGTGATFSETFWSLWANQPWVPFLLSHVIACPVWFLLGHFAAQSQGLYEAYRKGDR